LSFSLIVINQFNLLSKANSTGGKGDEEKISPALDGDVGPMLAESAAPTFFVPV
jgi:hypothetical protein